MANKLEEVTKRAGDTVQHQNGFVKKGANNASQKIKKFLMVIGLITVLGICGYIGFNYLVAIKVAEALSISAITEKVEITNIHIEEKLEAIGELSTYSFEYTNEKRIKDTRELFGTPIPGTTKEIEIIYSGVIKVGYEISEIACDVDNSNNKIYITIPEIKVLDSYIKLDDLQCKERNNILNPIGTDEITGYFQEIEREELLIAENQGIYDKAETQLKTIIEELLAGFEDYEVVFMT